MLKRQGIALVAAQTVNISFGDQDPAAMMRWAQRRGLASLSVNQVSLLLRRLDDKFDVFWHPFFEQEVGVIQLNKHMAIPPHKCPSHTNVHREKF